MYELEVTLASAPHHDAIVIDRSQPGDHCQMTLERWLPISDEPDVEDAVTAINAVLAASVFHFGTLRISQVKDALSSAGHPVRP